MPRSTRARWFFGALSLAVLVLGCLLLVLRPAPPRSQPPQAPSVISPPSHQGHRSAPAPSVARAAADDSASNQLDDASLMSQPATAEEFWRELERLELTDKRLALHYALQGEQWYEGDAGKAREARSAKIVTLLVALDRMDEARVRTRAFIESYPNSPYRPLVQGVTGIHPRPGRPPR
jgi:hypothetical protein